MKGAREGPHQEPSSPLPPPAASTSSRSSSSTDDHSLSAGRPPRLSPMPVRNGTPQRTRRGRALAFTKKTEETHTAHKVAMLRGVSFLQDLDEGSLRQLAQQLTTVHFDPGEVVFEKGDMGEEMFFIYEGLVEVRGRRVTLTAAQDNSKWHCAARR